MSKDAQLKIINILCVNAASFHKKLHSQYFLILIKLLEYYKDFPNSENKKLKLENFTPEIVQIPNVDINLNPIYVEVKDIATCKSLINLILQLLSESIPLSLLQNNENDLEEKAFVFLLDAIQNFSVDIKFVCFNFFLSLIKNMNKMSITNFSNAFHVHYKTLLNSLEAIAQNMSVLYEKCEIDNILLNDFNIMLLEYIKVIDCDRNTEKQVILRISSIILGKVSSRLFNKELKLYCLSLSSKIDLSNEFLNISDMDYCEIEKLAECYSNKMLEHIQMSKGNNEINTLQENWHYNQALSVINSIRSCEQSNTDIFLINYYLQRCHRALEIMEIVECKVKKLRNDNTKTNNETLSMQNIKTVWTSLIQIQKQHKYLLIKNPNCYELIMNIVISTVNLASNLTRDEASVILRLLCLYEIQSPEKNFPFSDSVRLKILNSLLIAKLHIRPKTGDWDSVISTLYNFLLKNKDSINIKEVNIYVNILFLVLIFLVNYYVFHYVYFILFHMNFKEHI